MALRIFGFQGPGNSDLAVRQAPQGPAVDTVDVAGAAAASDAVGKNVVLVTLQADEDCHVRFTMLGDEGGAAQDATTDCYKLSAGVSEDFSAPFGSFKKVSVIEAA